MPIDIYETRTMLQAIEQMMPLNTFLRDTFFPNVLTFVTEQVDVDYKKGKRKMAPFVARKSGGITMDRGGFKTDTFTTPYIAPQRLLTKNDISNRMLGENIYSRRSPEERALELLANDLSELDEMITRREEWFCREILLNGAVTIKGWVDKVGGADFVEDSVDFNLTNKEILAGADVWTADTCDMYGDLKAKRLEVIQKTGVAPNVVIMAQNVVDLFVNNLEIQKLLDIRNLTIGTVQPRYQGRGGFNSS